MEFNYYLPKIKRLKIDNFDLYKCPLEIDLSDKLNIIFGTNGLGKTTLLNIIRYSVIGPYKGRERVRNYKDQQKSRRPMFDRDYFKNRMQVPLNEAEVEVEFSIANDTFVTKHSLYSHRLISFSVNGKKEEEREKGLDYEKYERKYFSSINDKQLSESLINKYHKELIKSSGFPDINSFILMLTEIMFFSEARNFVFWDENLSKLVLSKFMPREKYFEYSETQKLIKKYDSQARLRSYKMSMVKEFLGEDLNKSDYNVYSLKDLEDVEFKIKTINTKIHEYRELLNKRTQERLQNRAEIDRLRAELAVLENKWYRNIFPNDYQDFYDKFTPILSSGVCPFCGTEHIDFHIDILECFFCKSRININTDVDLTEIEIKQKNLQIKKKTLDLRYEELNKEIEVINNSVKDGESELFETTKEKLKIKRKMDSVPNDNLEKYNQLNLEKELFLNKLEETKKKENQLADDIDQSIKSVFLNFSKIFYKYAYSFLGNDSNIRLELVGSGENTLFKFFLNNSARESEESLSESQRIFIDMAFRLATLEFFHKDTYFMSETPDSTLDYLFEENAVDTFNSYLKSGNTLFLSANARNSSLVSSLIKKNSSIKIINLLDISRHANKQYKEIEELDIYKLLRR
ncbi:chromosome segregation ATPase family protein [Streptococcus sanguinis SK1058]|jgi:hypothetical protein|uniref:AAA family ATPase n=1 Tax=Streptococcus sanguinis TaxID=1305 RepID=UPI000204C57E|nr:AAA family ATPase [Streptococcus sanguinis]EGF21848.1 chromosome segregation ATPase family protein [Streptococcus sanguinis SK1058]